MQIKVDDTLIEELRKDFCAEKCARALLTCVTDLLAAIGVKVQWSIEPVTDTTVDRNAFSAQFGKLAAVIGSLAAGARFNPIQYTKEKDHEARTNRKTASYFSSRTKADEKAT